MERGTHFNKNYQRFFNSAERLLRFILSVETRERILGREEKFSFNKDGHFIGSNLSRRKFQSISKSRPIVHNNASYFVELRCQDLEHLDNNIQYQVKFIKEFLEDGEEIREIVFEYYVAYNGLLGAEEKIRQRIKEIEPGTPAASFLRTVRMVLDARANLDKT